MSAIADACAIIVFFQDPDPASRMPNAYPYMTSREVHVPPMVVWEICRKAAIGKLPALPVPLPDLLRRHGFNLLPLSWEIAALGATLPPIHSDPFDRLLVAHSRVQTMPILTDDAIIPRYGVTTIW